MMSRSRRRTSTPRWRGADRSHSLSVEGIPDQKKQARVRELLRAQSEAWMWTEEERTERGGSFPVPHHGVAGAFFCDEVDLPVPLPSGRETGWQTLVVTPPLYRYFHSVV